MAGGEHDQTAPETGQSKDLPAEKFIQAIIGTEQYPPSPTKSALSQYAQHFDFVTGSTGATFEGDTEKLKRRAATRLRGLIDGFEGPGEIQQIYLGLYDGPITEIIGERRPEGQN